MTEKGDWEGGENMQRTTKGKLQKRTPLPQDRRGHRLREKRGWKVVNGTDEMILLIRGRKMNKTIVERGE
jgi:hypothetical protein